MGREELERSTAIADERLGKSSQQYHTKGDGYEKEPGFYLKEARLRLGLSQSDVAAGICDVSYLSKLENLEIPWEDGNLRQEQLRERLGIESFPKVRGNWLLKYQELFWSRNTGALRVAVNSMKDGFQHRMLLLALYVLLDMTGKANHLVSYFRRLEPYLSVYELQLYYLCLGCQMMGYEQGYYLLHSLRMARYAQLQDPFLYMALSKYLFTAGLHSHGQKLLREAEQVAKQLAATSYYIDYLTLSAIAYLQNSLTDSAAPKLEVLRSIKHQASAVQKGLYLLALGLYHQRKNQSQQAESAFIRSLAMTRHNPFPNSELPLIQLAALYSDDQKEKGLQKLVNHPRLAQLDLPKNWRHKLTFYEEKARQEPATNPSLFVQLNLGGAFREALDNHDADFLKLYGKTLMAYYEKHGKYKKAVAIQQELDRFEHTVKTFQITLNESIQI